MQDQLFAYFIQQLLESIIDMTLVAESKGGAGVRPPPLFLEQTEARRAEKIFLESAPPYF